METYTHLNKPDLLLATWAKLLLRLHREQKQLKHLQAVRAHLMVCSGHAGMWQKEQTVAVFLFVFQKQRWHLYWVIFWLSIGKSHQQIKVRLTPSRVIPAQIEVCNAAVSAPLCSSGQLPSIVLLSVMTTTLLQRRLSLISQCYYPGDIRKETKMTQ